MREVAAIAAILMAGCATAEPEAVPPVAGTAPHACRQFSSDTFVGREATAELGAEFQRVSGARVIRWIQPGIVVTMDFREDRLTVRLDERNRVQSASCG